MALLTKSPSAYMFLCYGKYRNQLHQYLCDNIRHMRVQRDLRIKMETKVSKAFEEFEEGVIARAYSISRLRSSNIGSTQPANFKEGTYGKEHIDPTKMSLAGWNGVLWGKSENKSIGK